MCLPNYLFFLCLKLPILSDVAFSWLVSWAWLAIGFFQVFPASFHFSCGEGVFGCQFYSRRFVVVFVLFCFVLFGGGGGDCCSGLDDNVMQKFPNFSFFCGSFVITPCTVLCWRLMRDEYLSVPLCFVFVAFTCVFGTCEARFMKHSSSSHDSEIHKHFQDKGYFLLLLPDLCDLPAKVHSSSH